MAAKPRSTRAPQPPVAPLAPRMVEMPPLSLRAEIVPKSFNDEGRTVELTFSTGAAVERFDWMSGQRYLEVLSLEPESVRLDRLNAGGPLLDAHSAWSVSDQLGAVVPGTVSLVKKEARATVRFSKREAVEPIWQDVRDGIIRSVSVGYRVYTFEESKGNGNKLPTRKATDWEPFEVSMVPIPADAGAKVRGQAIETNHCEIVPPGYVTRGEQTTTREDTPMLKNDDGRSETIVEPDPLTPPPTADPPAPEPNERDAGAEQERARIQGILVACRAARLPQSFADTLIASKATLEECQSKVFVEMGRRDPDVPRGSSRPGDVRITGEDPFVHVRAGIENAILHRVKPESFKLEDVGRPYRGMTMLRIAEAYLAQRGIRTTGMSKMELAGLAMGLDHRAGMHTTSDFANLLADVANKTLRAAYMEAPQTFTPISRRVTLPDFKPAKRLQLGEAPAMLEVLEHGEFTRGTMGEGKEQFQLATYGRIFAITRKALVNDDTDAFSRVATLFGRSARNLESDLVWQQITANGLMGDGVALFASGHANLSGTSDAIAVASIGAGRAAMRKQTALDAVTLLNVFPRFLIVPAAKETIADQFVSQNLLASAPGSVNPFAGRLTVIAEPRLDANSAVAWYLAAEPAQIDIIEYAFLEGEEGPMVESRVGFDVDGLEVKARHDFAAKVIDHRGLWKNPGA